jgi:hypothetical protein
LQRNENGEGLAEGEGKTGGSRALLRKTVIRIRGNFEENCRIPNFDNRNRLLHSTVWNMPRVESWNPALVSVIGILVNPLKKKKKKSILVNGP